MYPSCPKCGCKALNIYAGAVSLVYFPPRTDENGVLQVDPKLEAPETYKCRKCGHRFEKEVPVGV